MIKERQEAYEILNIVKNENITYLRVDRYDGFLFDDFEISKFWPLGKRIDTVNNFLDEIQNNVNYFNYGLFITNECGSLICRLFNTLEQAVEYPDFIKSSTQEMIDEAFFDKHLITFKQYNTYMKNRGGN